MTSYITSHGKEMSLMSFAFFFWLLSGSGTIVSNKIQDVEGGKEETLLLSSSSNTHVDVCVLHGMYLFSGDVLLLLLDKVNDLFLACDAVA